MKDTRVFGQSSQIAGVRRITASTRDFEKLSSRVRHHSTHYQSAVFNDRAKAREYKGDIDGRVDIASDSVGIAKSIFQKFHPLKDNSELVLFISKTFHTQ